MHGPSDGQTARPFYEDVRKHLKVKKGKLTSGNKKIKIHSAGKYSTVQMRPEDESRQGK